jgi:ectoine hydroxylase-related dioxygenase (phytanoyl-CoA dioxygenase family)
VIDIGPVCRQFAYDRRLFDILRALYDDEAHLFKDKLIFKPPGATGYALHQDYIGWREFPESFITLIVAIDETNAANGATEVFPGYHKRGYLSPKDGDYHHLPEDAVDLPRASCWNSRLAISHCSAASHPTAQPRTRAAHGGGSSI